MGRTARWFRAILGGKKPSPRAITSDSKPPKDKRRWGFVRSLLPKDRFDLPSPAPEPQKGSCRDPLFPDANVDPSKHAIAVAAATAAVAEAAVAAAQAAAAVAKLTTSGRCAAAHVCGRREEFAAVKIQSAFRGYLARRALKALKGLVRLQALVRGHIVRKQAADALRCMQSLVRVQARALALRGSQLYLDPSTPERHKQIRQASSEKHGWHALLKRNTSKSNGTNNIDQERIHMEWNWLDHWMDGQHKDQRAWSTKGMTIDDEKSDKILEVDPGKPLFDSKRSNSNRHSSHSALNSHSFTTLPDSPSKDSTTAQLSFPSPSSVEMQSRSPLRFPVEIDDLVFCASDSSPQFFSATSRSGSARRGPFTPVKSDCSRSLLSGYSDYPNYMANTESSRAKVRSQSAPKQRPEFEKSGSTRTYVHGFGDATMSTNVLQSPQKSSSLHARFTSKAYPGSGRLDRIGTPLREGVGMGCNGAKHSRSSN